jgi:hypothetical protein
MSQRIDIEPTSPGERGHILIEGSRNHEFDTCRAPFTLYQ